MENERLAKIWRVFNFYGFSIIDRGWRMNARAFLIISFMSTMYLNDIKYIIDLLWAGHFNIGDNIVILTSLQIQTIITYRLYLLLSRKKSFEELMRLVTEEFPGWIEREDLRRSILKAYKRGTWICWTHFIQVLSNAILARMVHIFDMKANLLPMSSEDENLFTTRMKLVCRVCYMVMALSLTMAWNLLLFTLIMMACAHLEHLAFEMKLKHSGQEQTACAIRNLVDRYNKIRNFVDLYNELFSALNAVHPFFVGFSTIAAMLVFYGDYQFYTMVNVVFTHIFELFMYCYAGDQISEKSQGLGDQIYTTDWYNMSPRNKKSILQILQQCQKPFTVSAGIFGDFSMRMFSMTMKTTYSVWTVVSQTIQMHKT